MTRPRVALATCAVLPEPDPDDAPLRAALEEAGLAPLAVAWDGPDPLEPLDSCALCVLRSTWNYPQAPEAFLDWLGKAAQRTTVVNHPAIVRWNLHKRYLLDLAQEGAPVVGTLLVEQGGCVDLAREATLRSWRHGVVVKPAVSAASFRTQRFGPGELAAAQAFLDELTQERDALAQPYLSSVEGPGERSLVWVAGCFTHAVRKAPRFAGQNEEVAEKAVPIEPDERAAAERVLEAFRRSCPQARKALYLRVDLMRDERGAPALSELECVEPSLFFAQGPEALARFVAAIVRLTRSGACAP